MKVQVIAYTLYKIQVLEAYWNKQTLFLAQRPHDALKVLIPPQITTVCRTAETWAER